MSNITTSGSLSSQDDIVVEIKNLTKIYGDGTIGVDNLSLTIKRGEIFGFLGQYGSGKTTMIRTIMNILIPQEGEVYIKGEKISRGHFHTKTEIGYMPEEFSIPEYFRVQDYLNYIVTMRRSSGSRMEEIAKLFDLNLDMDAQTISKEDKRKVGIVLAFMDDPEILILDEPTSGLSLKSQQLLYELLLEEKQRNKTIILSSHHLDRVQKCCDRVGMIKDGKLLKVVDIDNLAQDVSRRIKITLENISEEIVNHFYNKYRVVHVDHESRRIEIEAPTIHDLVQIIVTLEKQGGIEDLDYPKTSLEEYMKDKFS